MDEFVGRMDTQRKVLSIVNRSVVAQEKLFGLSSQAINRWATQNQFGGDSTLVDILRYISSLLFFMATRSQEPVSAEYKLRERKIIEAVNKLGNAV